MTSSLFIVKALLMLSWSARGTAEVCPSGPSQSVIALRPSDVDLEDSSGGAELGPELCFQLCYRLWGNNPIFPLSLLPICEKG